MTFFLKIIDFLEQANILYHDSCVLTLVYILILLQECSIAESLSFKPLSLIVLLVMDVGLTSFICSALTFLLNVDGV